MTAPREIRDRLRRAAAAAFAHDAGGLDITGAWLLGASSRDLVRVDGVARQLRYDRPLGGSEQWTRAVLHSSPTAAAIASTHPDGHLRERALHRLAVTDEPPSDLAIALRTGDHVEAVRELATSMLRERTDLAQAVRMMPILLRIDRRPRGTDAGQAYLQRLTDVHGIDQAWLALRGSNDRDLRRFAYRRSAEASLIDLGSATTLIRRERDQVVRRTLARVIADRGDPATIREVLLRGRSAENRVLALVRLGGPELPDDDVFPLLADSSMLVRLWARKRWEERGGDAVTACRTLVTSDASPARRALAYSGLAEAGGHIGRTEILGLIRDPHPTLQQVGLRLLVSNAESADAAQLLDMVRSEHARVARLAVDVLAADLRLWTLDHIRGLRDDPSPDIRRRAWMLHRSRGGWESLIADLEILGDPDEGLASLGRRPRIPMYESPSPAQRIQIDRLLTDAVLDRGVTLGIAFAAGLDHVAAAARSQPPQPLRPGLAPASEHASDPWWRAVFRRRTRRSRD